MKTRREIRSISQQNTVQIVQSEYFPLTESTGRVYVPDSVLSVYFTVFLCAVVDRVFSTGKVRRKSALGRFAK